jgi:hypothetical protein
VLLRRQADVGKSVVTVQDLLDLGLITGCRRQEAAPRPLRLGLGLGQFAPNIPRIHELAQGHWQAVGGERTSTGPTTPATSGWNRPGCSTSCSAAITRE